MTRPLTEDEGRMFLSASADALAGHEDFCSTSSKGGGWGFGPAAAR